MSIGRCRRHREHSIESTPISWRLISPELDTHESGVVTASQANQDTLVAKTRNICQNTICTRRERARVLQTTLSDISKNAIWSCRLVCLQAVDSVVLGTRECKLQ
jgi:hypothetical protein